MGNMKISVIIPVYNTEKYVRKCIKSVISQSYKNLEIIVIDDGSTDNSLNICQEMAMTDTRISIYHQENGGVSVARNMGLTYATGEWVSFIDSDDYLDTDFYETLIKAVSFDVSIICCGVRSIDEDGREVRHLQYNAIPKEEGVISGPDIWKHFLHPSKRFLYWSPWDKLLRTSLAKKYQFLVGRKIGEDLFYCFQCLRESGRIYYIPNKKYNYLIRKGSATHSNHFSNAQFDSLSISKIILEEGSRDRSLEYYARLNFLAVASRIVRGYYSLSKGDKQFDSEIQGIRSLIKSNLKAYCIKELNFKHLCLVVEAAYLPFLFKIR